MVMTPSPDSKDELPTQLAADTESVSAAPQVEDARGAFDPILKFLGEMATAAQSRRAELQKKHPFSEYPVAAELLYGTDE
jgi:hypothetical protein